VEGLEQKIALSKFFAFVTPNGDLKKGWKEYYDKLLT